MKIFSKRSILALAAMFLASTMFVGCGDDEEKKVPDPNPNPGPGPNPTPGALVVLDNFDLRVIDDEGNEGYTNQNLLPSKGGREAGSWYAWDWNLKVTDHDGENIVGLSGEDWINKVLGDGNMNAIISAQETPGTAYGGAVETYFFTDESVVDISALKSVRIKGKLQGAVYVGILTSAWDSEKDGGVWAWEVIKGDEFIDFNEVLSVSQSSMTSTWGPNSEGGTLAANLANAIGITIALHTTETDFAFFAIDEVSLDFGEESNIPEAFKPE